MSSRARRIFAWALVAVFWPSWAWAAQVDLEKSSIKATFTQFNVPITGEFGRFRGSVSYSPNALDAAQASLSVVTGSYDLGDDQYNQEVAGPDWFDTANHPEAQFELKSTRAQGGGFVATGQMTLRGKTLDLVFPVQVTEHPNAYVFTGQAEIKRLDFGVGQGDWGDTTLVEDEVQIDFELVVPR